MVRKRRDYMGILRSCCDGRGQLTILEGGFSVVEILSALVGGQITQASGDGRRELTILQERNIHLS